MSIAPTMFDSAPADVSQAVEPQMINKDDTRSAETDAGTVSNAELDHKFWVIPMVMVSLTPLLGILLLYIVGIFPVPTSDTGEKTLAAALVLVGTLVTASVSLIALVVKTSLDNRTQRLERIEAERNHKLAKEAERRNRIDTVIRAVALLGVDGRNATQHQISGALLALVSLEEHKLAVALAGHLWPSNLLSRRAIAQIVKEGFNAGSEDVQYSVAMLLRENPDKMQDSNRHLLWPSGDLEWPSTAPPKCRITLVIAAMQAFIEELRRTKEWMPTATAVLVNALRDEEPQVQNLAECVLRPFAERASDTAFIQIGAKVVSIADVREALSTEWKATSKLAMRSERQVTDLMADVRAG